MIRRPEILAPAGTPEAARAALKAGANAIYAGGSLFSARAFAGNFNEEEMIKAIDECHFYDAKLYMTVNTLMKDNEMGMLVDYMRPYYKAGVDGIIVQDMGVAAVLAREFPDLPLHGSTQMTVCSHYGVELLKKLGFKRVVPARELSLEEVRAIRENTNMEIETFVHGAMCFAYSGKCLFSSFAGGRSGNRGRCAQPCRQRYNVKDAASEYAMSLKDMCTLRDVPKLIEAGIDSFKIEGRMKKPEYVASATAAYRMAVDMFFDNNWDVELIDRTYAELMDIYNRGGFHNGYYFTDKGHVMIAADRPNHSGVLVGEVTSVKGPDVFIGLEADVNIRDVLEIREAEVELTSNAAGQAGETISLKGKELKYIKPGMQVYRTRNNALIDRINKEIIEPEKKLKAQAFVGAYVGEPLTISICDEHCSVSVSGDVVEEASSRPTDEQTIIDKMKKTGGTGVELDVMCGISPNAFVQMSALNALRRSALDAFKEAKIAEKHR